MKLSHAICWMMLMCGTVSAQERPTFSLSEEATVETTDAAAEERPAAAESATRRTQWLMFTAAWCRPCAAAKDDFVAWLRRGGWIVDDGESAHVRLIDGDVHPKMVERHQITQYPTFLLLQDGNVLFRHSGYPGREALVSRYQQAVTSSSTAVGAVSVGTLKGQRENIAQLIHALQPALSGGGTLTVRLDRTESKTAALPWGESLAVRFENPLVMNFTLRNERLICRFDEPLPRVRLSWGVPWEQSVTAVTISVAEIVLEMPRAPDVRLRVEP